MKTLEQEITVIIKTIDRTDCLKKLVKSILRKYPNIRILIGDDSKVSCRTMMESAFPKGNIEVFELPYDCGLSYGRNVLVKQVTTPYFLLCDDDFIFDKKTDVAKALALLKEHDVDIIGGYMRNYKIIKGWKDKVICLGQKILRYELPTNYIGTLRQEGSTFYAHYIIHEYPEFTVTDLVPNFFIAKTEVICKQNLWDEDLKLQEHTEFFYRAKQNGLKVAFTNHLSSQHHPVHSKNYGKLRGRNYTQVFMEKYHVNKIVQTSDEPSREQVIEKE